ncbi:MAG: exonuclease [Clostridiales Family XIII bacterium]|jgi:DNA polymerase-3 subunit epsilon|nr:exonuclease [Clostridiales Family XIII bacterium]
MNYIIFDVETPNRRNDRICQIAVISHREIGDKISVKEKVYLINPETNFEKICIDIHGISEEDVIGEKTFEEIWENDLKEMFNGSIFVAHNAPFDIRVLQKTLAFYNINIPNFESICTVQLSKQIFPSLSNHQLITVAKHLGFNLEKHHDAKYDARAAYEIFLHAKKRFPEILIRNKKPQEETKKKKPHKETKKKVFFTPIR